MDEKQTPQKLQYERKLVRELRQGRQAALKELMIRHEDRVYRLAYSITLDAEESLEIVQDVFIKAFETIGNFREDASLSTWLRKITVNMCLNWKRKWKRRFRWSHTSIDREAEYVNTAIEPKTDTPESDLAAKEFEGAVMKEIAKLPEELRTILVLKTVENMSYREISDTLRIKRGTVASRLYKARRMILDAVGDSDDG